MTAAFRIPLRVSSVHLAPCYRQPCIRDARGQEIGVLGPEETLRAIVRAVNAHEGLVKATENESLRGEIERLKEAALEEALQALASERQWVDHTRKLEAEIERLRAELAAIDLRQDHENPCSYLTLAGGRTCRRQKQVTGPVVLDLSKDGQLLGIEFQNDELAGVTLRPSPQDGSAGGEEIRKSPSKTYMERE